MIVYLGNMLSVHGKSFSFAEAFIPLLKNENYKIVGVSNKKNQIIRLLHMCYTLLRLSPKAKLVIIDSYSTSAFWYTVICSALCRILGKKYICVLHGGDFPTRLANSPKLCAFVFKHSLINISPSLYLKHHFSNAGFKVQYIPNFINITDYNYNNKTYNKPRLLWVRAFHKTYNPTLAPKIIAELITKYSDIELCMVGGQADKTFNETQLLAKELGVADNINYKGRLTKKEWRELAADYNIFINTTNYDNQPVSVVEAMALGLPVVSTNVGGLKYLIQNEENGLLVEPDNAKIFAERIDQLIMNPTLAEKIATNARKKVEGFDWQTSIRAEWHKIINTAIN